jgi:hypothetical protein
MKRVNESSIRCERSLLNYIGWLGGIARTEIHGAYRH